MLAIRSNIGNVIDPVPEPPHLLAPLLDPPPKLAPHILERKEVKERIVFFSDRIKDIKKSDRKTFMTAPEMGVACDTTVEVKAPEVVIVSKDIVKEYRSMLSDVLNTQRSVRAGTDDL